MPKYDGQQFDPPAPAARVTIRTLDHVRSVDNIMMLIDSGADVTLIPRACAERLGLDTQVEASFCLQGFSGSPSSARIVVAELVFLGRNFRGHFLLADGEYGILGRNVLNNLSLLLDGPCLNWQEAPEQKETSRRPWRRS